MSMLAILTIIAGRWKLFVLATILIAAGTVCVLYFTPSRFQSEAIVELPLKSRALIKTATILDPVIQKAGLTATMGGSVDAARESLRANLKLAQNQDNMTRLTFEDRTAAGAKRVLDLVITEVVASSRVEGPVKAAIERKIDLLKDAVSDLRKIPAQIARGPIDQLPGNELNGYARAHVLTMDQILRMEDEIAKQQELIEGLGEQHILQHPTLPDAPIPRGNLKTVALAVLIGNFAVLFVLVFFRWYGPGRKR